MSQGPLWKTLPPQLNFSNVDHEILDFWQREHIFHRSVESRIDGEPWTFFEGPPTANGMPGTHHVEARVFKDVFPRYHTMKGRHVTRKAGWDCHGLPVELAVEKELGFTGKQDIEKFGIAAFNEKCRESVQRYVGAFEEMTTRMGFWVDFDSAYWTMSPEYVESVWWSLKQIWDKGLLVQDHRVAPYCPRCGTGLSDHELAQGYETVVDPSVFIRFPIIEGEFTGASLLVWTTTPWTLVSNTAVAVNPDVDYVLAKDSAGELFIVAQALMNVLGEETTVIKVMTGRSLERIRYQRPFELVEIENAHYVVLADYVTVEDGTGLVHQSPAFGADDLAVCRRYGLPVVNPINADGTFQTNLEMIGGTFFKDADKVLVKDLKNRNLLFKHLPYEHSYPHCWRCHTPLMYYAQPSWYIRTTEIKNDLINENQKTNWYPETIKNGRFGDWLNNNIDWALSRNRYWGTPLPIWRCDEDNSHMECFDSLQSLGNRSNQDLSNLDPHRPFVDDISFECAQCSGKMLRVSEVIDCWYDSGAMPFAQWGYPHKPGSEQKFAQAYPADFVCEAIDQTRGWFYTLMAIGTLVFEKSSFETVLCLGHILDKDGRKMSKHIGNVLEPLPLMNQHGADAVRWFMLAAGSPWSARRVSHEAIAEVIRKTLLTYWNTASFLSSYAKIANFDPTIPVAQRTTMDRWILSELHQTIEVVDQSLEAFDSQAAGKAIADFIDNLSNWYVRRSRRRFWDGEPAALATLFEALRDLTLLMAPMVPFITEYVWQEMIRPVLANVETSVHLTDWPRFDRSVIDHQLSKDVSQVRRLVELGRAARAESNTKVRQPLQRALISSPGWQSLSDELRSQIAEELNVIELQDISTIDVVDFSVKPNFKSLGSKFGKETSLIAEGISKCDPTEIVSKLRNGVEFSVQGKTIELDDVIITETPRIGWTFASHQGESLALDITITPDLRKAGLVREAIRLIQDSRKQNGFDISDRIKVSWNAKGDMREALLEGHGAVAEEVLAVEMIESESNLEYEFPELGFSFSIALA